MAAIEKTDAQIKVIARALQDLWSDAPQLSRSTIKEAEKVIDWLNNPETVPRPEPTMEEVLAKAFHTPNYSTKGHVSEGMAAALRSMGYKLVKE